MSSGSEWRASHAKRKRRATPPRRYTVAAVGGHEEATTVPSELIHVGATSVRFLVEETGHFQILLPRDLGRVSFAKAGEYSLWIKPQRKAAGAIMDVRRGVLLPVKDIIRSLS